MKRARRNTDVQQAAEFEQLEQACAAAKARYDALAKQLWNHPMSEARRKQEARDAVLGKVPVELHDAWITRAGLTDLDVLGYADDDGTRAYRTWTFRVRLDPPNGRPERYQVTLTYDDFTQEWSFDDAELNPVAFDKNPRRMWRAALEANDGNVAEAMAAFCHACCEQMGDMSAVPNQTVRPLFN